MIKLRIWLFGPILFGCLAHFCLVVWRIFVWSFGCEMSEYVCEHQADIGLMAPNNRIACFPILFIEIRVTFIGGFAVIPIKPGGSIKPFPQPVAYP